MSDLISRQAAIDALERTKEKEPKGDIACFYNKITDNKIAVIKALPSADVRPVVRGEWVYKEFRQPSGSIGYYQCPICNNITTIPKENFCSNCGADMRGEGE